MKPEFFHRGSRRAGFTLIELLVSMTILSIILIALGSATGYVSRLWLNGVGAMDNFTKARVVLTLLDRDIQMMVLRRDLAAFVDSSTPPNPACAFYTNVQGSPGTDTRAISLVQYRLATPATTPTLQRLNYGMNFLNTASAVTPTVSTASLTQLGNSNVQPETVFTGIIRFQIQFLDGTGAIQPTYSFTYSQPLPPANSRTVIVSMLVLSNPAYKLATQGGGTWMSSLANDSADFPTTALTNQTYSQVWNASLNSPSATLLSLPLAIRSGIQVFERHIPLPITTPSS
jgi:prepilin-type N-terminal cleavage/methylation domain-containing protein